MQGMVQDAGVSAHGDTTPGALTVTVRYFAAAAEAAAREEEFLDLTPGATLGDLKVLLAKRYGDLMQRVVENGSFLLDGVARTDPALPLTARVDVMPPFAGG